MTDAPEHLDLANESITSHRGLLLRIDTKIFGKSGTTRYTRTDIHEAACAERDRCHARLEIDHKFIMMDAGSELQRVDIPMDERAGFPDAVTCRDATIALLEDDGDELRADRDKLRNALNRCAEWRP